jgi:hypothetical protein
MSGTMSFFISYESGSAQPIAHIAIEMSFLVLQLGTAIAAVSLAQLMFHSKWLW